MKTQSLALIMTVFAVGTAAAQPAPPDPATPPIEPTPIEPTPSQTSKPIVSDTAPAAPTGRPVGLAFGIGVGYQFPTSLQSPNLTSVRLRLPTGLTFEPQVVFANSSDDTEVMNMTSSDTTSEVGIATVARFPVITRGNVDFELIGSLGVRSVKTSPDGANNNSKTKTLGVGWGVGMSYWFNAHWTLSLTASNPLAVYTTTTREVAMDLTTTSSEKTLGVIFEPRVALMIHLFN